MPSVGYTPELVLAGVFEGEAAAGGQIFDCLRHEDLIRLCQRAEPRADHHTEPSDLAIDCLEFARVHPGADLYAEWTDGLDEVLGTAHGPGRAVEGGQETVTCRVDLGAPEAAERS